MPDLWSVEWSADETGYRVRVCNRCRVLQTFSAECLEGESLAEVRKQAAARAVELALGVSEWLLATAATGWDVAAP